MFKRITALVLCLVLAVSLVPGAAAAGRQPIAPASVDRCCSTLRVNPLTPDYVRPAYDGYLIEITPQRVQDTFDYLDEHYVKNHPEQALMVYTGTPEDKEVLKTLAETITAGCTTNKEKADAIGGWLSRNIFYDIGTSAYASDTFYRREGNCLSYANLMMFLLRSLGIPAVIGDGWRGNMKTSTVDLFNQEGHAWCFVRLDGEWVLYDPLWLDGGTTDRSYMAEWIYFDTVETICPASDGNNLPPEAYDKPKAYYTDGRFYTWSEFQGNTMGNLTLFLNNQAYAYIANQCEGDIGDGICYLDGRDKSGMVRGELYRDGWASYGDYTENSAMHISYYFPNGMTADGYVATLDGRDRFMYTNTSNEILTDDYDIIEGYFSLKPGFTGPFLGLSWQDGVMDDTHEYITTWASQNPDVVSVDQNGNIICHREGYAIVDVSLERVEHNGNLSHLAGRQLSILVSTEARIPDYSDRAPCEHAYELNGTVGATCTDWGYGLYICTLCGARTEVYTEEPLGHKYVHSVLTKPTCVSGGTNAYTCSRCSHSYTETTAVDPNAHAWNDYACTLCGLTRLTLFNDVAPGSFYEVPVAWAVERGITSGQSATQFGAAAACNRAQVVTFLWAAAGRPDPKSTVNPFTDVPKGSFFEKAVLWAVEQGITSGTDATHFNPGQSCNRATVVTFLWSAAGKPAATGENPFTDVPAGSWYEKPVIWAKANGVTSGVSNTMFGAANICNRAQVVTFLYAARDLLNATPPQTPDIPSVPGLNVPPSDPNGTTYILNLSTMKFHYPKCSSVDQIIAENYYEYIGTREALIDYDYSPCGRCDP